MTVERPFVDGRRTAVFVFNELRVDGGRLTQLWLGRLRAFAAAGWATHAALINKNPALAEVVAALVADGRLPADTAIHHYAARDRRIRPSWYGPLPEGSTNDDRIGDWLDWLTGQIPGAVVFADSPAAYPYLARMSNPLVARVAGIHLSHLARGATDLDPTTAELTPRFAERFDPCHDRFDALVVATRGQAADLRARYGSDLPVVTIPPAVPAAGPPTATGPVSNDEPDGTRSADPPARAGARRIVAVGPLEPAAHHDDAIRAFQTIAADHPDTVLQVVGAGDAGPLRSLADELGLADRVWVIPPAPDPDAPFPGAAAALWTARRESVPLIIVQALRHGVPVVARDARYGPSELVTDPALGEVVPAAAGLGAALGRLLAARREPQEVSTAAADLLRRTDPAEVGTRWVALAGELADLACDHRAPSLLVESVDSTARVLRMPGILADSGSSLASWSCELPGLVEPAGWLTEQATTSAGEADGDDLPTHPHAAGPTREVVVQLRSNALAFVVTETGTPYRLEFTDGTASAPLLTTAFDDRLIASRVGNATLTRREDGTVWVAPLPELIFASNVDGRLLVRLTADGPPSDITHAVSWGVDIAWSDMTATPQGATFTGILRAVGIAPAPDSAPAICVPDVGGFSRVVGTLHYLEEPTAVGQEWSARVGGVIEVDALVATTQLARRALSLHVGFRGLLVPVGSLWTHGDRAPIPMSCPRGEATLLPSPGGRVLAAPGKGYRARASGIARGLVRRG